VVRRDHSLSEEERADLFGGSRASLVDSIGEGKLAKKVMWESGGMRRDRGGQI
jgi:hypothetical protein